MKTRPPLSLLKSIILPFGARMKEGPKKPVEAVVVKPMYGGYRPNSDLYPTDRYSGCMNYCPSYPPRLPAPSHEPPPAISMVSGVPLGKGFNSSDYYLWYGSGFAASSWSACRACLYVAWDAEERSHHMKLTKCDKAIWKVVKMLCKGQQCAVCNEKTGGEHWEYGVYLCSDMCRMKWMVNEKLTRENIEQALKLIDFKPEIASN